MATVTATRFVPGTSNFNRNGADSKVNLARVGARNQAVTVTHNGLRSLNEVDRLRMRINTKAVKQGHPTANRGYSRKIVCGTGMNIVFVSAECGPWSKTGGLGDVLGGLPPAMAANGHRVMTVSPRYDQYKDAWDTSVAVDLKIGDGIETVRFFHCYKRGVDRIFIDHPMFLEKVWGKTASKIYGPSTGVDYKDNQLRFSLLCKAALEAPRILNLKSNKYFSGRYGEDVIFVANDWHTALLPCYLKSNYQSKGMYPRAKVVFCIHNIAYQGRFPFEDYSLLNLPDRFKSSFDFFDGYKEPVKGRKINWMKAAILESHRVMTVSPYYAEELVSGEDRGVELNTIIRKTGITGIVNGMDVQEWDPMNDKYLSVKYDRLTVKDMKPLIKEALQSEVGLPCDRDVPLIGFIGRLEEQKGSDILTEAIPKFIGRNCQIVVLGTGKEAMENQIKQLEIKYPDKARGIAKFDVRLAHMIIAGCDFILVPSRFEPCGLIQLHAMRYGTVPIVASTGGLVNTVSEGFTGFQMGAFNIECDEVDPIDVDKVVKTVYRALGTYGTITHRKLVQNCMGQDLSWKWPSVLWEKVLFSLNVAGSESGIKRDEIAPLAKENVATP